MPLFRKKCRKQNGRTVGRKKSNRGRTVKEGRCEQGWLHSPNKALDKSREQGPTTYVNTIHFLLFSIFTALIARRSGLTAENEAVWKKTEEDGFRQVHDSFAVDAETLSPEV